MKQVLQSLRNGNTLVEDVPCPMVKPGHLLIRTHNTLVSVGTEKMLLDFGKANFVQKARQQPDKVRMVLDKIKTDGFMPTYESIRNKLDQPIAMGYCNVGSVLAVGDGVSDFEVGDRVVSNGNHAEVVTVPKNLCAKIPENVSDEEAAFTIISAIALQGIRLVAPTFGETVAVIGLGLVGLLTVQLLRANGCKVIGIDFSSDRVKLAEEFGALGVNLSKGEDPVTVASRESLGKGIDAVVIAASTQSNEPMHQAATMCRQRGRVVLVGVTGLELSRADFYEKEISFQVSCSYGPGRYDESYEQAGQDYPFGFVRWTEQRNFQAVLQALSERQLQVQHLVSHRFKLEDAESAYGAVVSGAALGVILECDLTQPEERIVGRRVIREALEKRTPESDVQIGFIGSGNYAGKVLMPAFVDSQASLHTVASSGGVTGVSTASKFTISNVVTDIGLVLNNAEINTVAIATRHDSHAKYTCDALAAGKHVFVEKPLALTRSQLIAIEEAYVKSQKLDRPPLLMIGFNRRFSPLVEMLQSQIIDRSEPISINMTINAGMIPKDSWIQNEQQGGGRIIGEACHFIDLCRFLVGEKIIHSHGIGMQNSHDAIATDKCLMNLQFNDGSIASIQYLANGSSAFPKERVEVFSEGKVFQIDNFRSLKSWGANCSKKLWRQDKGNNACVAAFVDAVRNGSPSPIAFEEMLEVSRATFDIQQQILGI
ncbi:MAG: bi-domain-containing oxidoreductase [Pseudomonadales bacterium]|nr:bi-domain-containing oxidoreductase [Pseudomonadales bacterium]